MERLSRRTIASRNNAAKGGLATAKNHSEEWLKERAKKGGRTLIEMYSTDYYRFINSQRRVKKGWPLGKLRKAVPVAEQEIQKAKKNHAVSEECIQALSGMLRAVPR